MKSILKPVLRIIPLTAVCLMLSASFAHAQASALTVGESAPLLQPAKWLKGTPIPQFEKGKVYVVEFWATWCGPCKANIPHLTEMAKKYKGKVEVIGVDIWESSDPTIKTLPKVEAFVKMQGKKMDYHVAADTVTNRIADAWMKSAGEGGIPTAFVIGKDGKIAWIGNPASGIEPVLDQVIAGTYDVAAARAQRSQKVGPMQAIQKAMNDKEYATASKLIDAEIVRNPTNERYYAYQKLTIQAHLDLPGFKDQARKILAETNGEISIYQMLCSIPASAKDLSQAAYKFGRGLVDEALVKKDREYLFYAMAAEMDSQLGDKAGAVRSQTASVKAAEVDSHCPPEFLEMLRKSLQRYQAAAGA